MYSSKFSSTPVRGQTKLGWGCVLAVGLLLVTPAATADTQLSLKPPQAPIAWTHTAEDILRIAREFVAENKKLQDRIGALAPEDCNFTSVILPIAHDEDLKTATTIVGLYTSVSPSLELRRASAETHRLIVQAAPLPKVYRAVFNAVKNLKASGNWDALSAEDKRFIGVVLRILKRAGRDLSEEKSTELNNIRLQFHNVTLEYMTNLNNDKSFASFTSAELQGVPMDVLSRYKVRTEGSNKLYDVPLKDMGSILTFAENPATRKRALETRETRLPENVPLVDRVLELRRRFAGLLGFDTWVDYVTETRVIKNAKGVNSFLDDLESKLLPFALRERETLLTIKEAEHRKKGLSFDGQLYTWDHTYYYRKFSETNLALNHTLVKEYFPVAAVVPAVLAVYRDLLGVRFEEVNGSSAWHPDVQQYAVWYRNATDATGFVGYFYLDLFSRDNKLAQPVAKQLRPGYERPDGTRSYPVSAMITSFQKPATNKPALLRHADVVTFFHELGHVFHHLLSRTKYSLLHGTTVSEDLVEAPSQMLENWCWEPEVLRSISSHYQTKEPLSTELINGIVNSRYLGVGLFEIRQLSYAKLDQQLHTSTESSINSTLIWNNIQRKDSVLKSDKPTSVLGYFSHMMNQYAGSYYTYAYSRVFAADMYATVFQANPLDPARGAKYVNAILQPGGSRDELDSLEDFLGRPPNSDAFIRAVSRGSPGLAS